MRRILYRERRVIRLNFRTKTTEWIDSFNEWIDSDHIRQDWKRGEYDEEWYVSKMIWIDSKCPKWGLIRFISNMNRFILSQRVWWNDSDIYDTIHEWIDSIFSDTIYMKSESLMKRFRHIWYDSWMNRFNIQRYDSHEVGEQYDVFQEPVNRFR